MLNDFLNIINNIEGRLSQDSKNQMLCYQEKTEDAFRDMRIGLVRAAT
jgi:hypothetical protein